MSTKHIRTAADLVRFGAGLRIDCRDCGNSHTLDGYEVAQRCGTKAIQAFMPRLKCSRCGARNAGVTVLSPPAGR